MAEVDDRLTRLELAVAHLTEAIEELAKVLTPGAAPSASRVGSHLRDVRENCNRFAVPVPRARD
ncbi:MAG TPA: hypothetical protein VKV36_05530 [Acidimicrobiales bacterium]|nr:hypothetical protein [Acidimicrobiales bacterium]HLH46372.1 hypothetical protein [Acidimicrobiales bacterium]